MVTAGWLGGWWVWTDGVVLLVLVLGGWTGALKHKTKLDDKQPNKASWARARNSPR